MIKESENEWFLGLASIAILLFSVKICKWNNDVETKIMVIMNVVK